jgi:hypothetical protein
MGVSTDAILAYGYDLGGDEDGWKVREAARYGELDLDWLDEEDEDSDGFGEQAMARIRAAAGFTETDWQAEGYFDRKHEAEAAAGVEIETYCSDEAPMYLLAATVHTVARGYIKDAAALIAAADDATRREWDAKLAAAVAALGLTPVQEQPSWLLCSYWG